VVVLVPADELEREPPPRLDGLDRLAERVDELDERLAALRVELAADADQGDRLDALERAVATLGEARHAQRELIKRRREETRALRRDLQALAKQVDELRPPNRTSGGSGSRSRRRRG
jgi:chromosome segregation ATPase